MLRRRLAPREVRAARRARASSGARTTAASASRDFIDPAKHTLWLQNERYQDTVIIERLVRARERGVKVHIMARPPHTLKKDKLIEGVGGLRIMHDVGAKIHKLKGLKLHGKMLLADDKRAIVGSINLAPGSFDARRELAIETDAHHVVNRLLQVRASRLGAFAARSTSPTKACSPISRSGTGPATPPTSWRLQAAARTKATRARSEFDARPRGARRDEPIRSQGGRGDAFFVAAHASEH